MQLTLVAVYLDETQLEYIISVRNGFKQENFNFNFEYYDAESEIAKHYNIQSYPTFLLLKNNQVSNIIEGKMNFSELKERLEKINYVSNGN